MQIFVVGDLALVHSPATRADCSMVQQRSGFDNEVRLLGFFAIEQLTLTQERGLNAFEKDNGRLLFFSNQPVCCALNVLLVLLQSTRAVCDLKKSRKSLIHF